MGYSPWYRKDSCGCNLIESCCSTGLMLANNEGLRAACNSISPDGAVWSMSSIVRLSCHELPEHALPGRSQPSPIGPHSLILAWVSSQDTQKIIEVCQCRKRWTLRSWMALQRLAPGSCHLGFAVLRIHFWTLHWPAEQRQSWTLQLELWNDVFVLSCRAISCGDNSSSARHRGLWQPTLALCWAL